MFGAPYDDYGSDLNGPHHESIAELLQSGVGGTTSLNGEGHSTSSNASQGGISRRHHFGGYGSSTVADHNSSAMSLSHLVASDHPAHHSHHTHHDVDVTQQHQHQADSDHHSYYQHQQRDWQQPHQQQPQHMYGGSGGAEVPSEYAYQVPYGGPSDYGASTDADVSSYHAHMHHQAAQQSQQSSHYEQQQSQTQSSSNNNVDGIIEPAIGQAKLEGVSGSAGGAAPYLEGYMYPPASGTTGQAYTSDPGYYASNTLPQPHNHYSSVVGHAYSGMAGTQDHINNNTSNTHDHTSECGTPSHSGLDSSRIDAYNPSSSQTHLPYTTTTSSSTAPIIPLSKRRLHRLNTAAAAAAIITTGMVSSPHIDDVSQQSHQGHHYLPVAHDDYGHLPLDHHSQHQQHPQQHCEDGSVVGGQTAYPYNGTAYPMPSYHDYWNSVHPAGGEEYQGVYDHVLYRPDIYGYEKSYANEVANYQAQLNETYERSLAMTGRTKASTATPNKTRRKKDGNPDKPRLKKRSKDDREDPADPTYNPAHAGTSSSIRSIHAIVGTPDSGTEGTEGEGKRTKRQKHVGKACVHCKKAHLACDDARPCRRCAHMGRLDCVDVEHKRRGRPRNSGTKNRGERDTSSASAISAAAEQAEKNHHIHQVALALGVVVSSSHQHGGGAALPAEMEYMTHDSPLLEREAELPPASAA
ncbi:hypothetical protein SmJEL517_g01886 [Synchytrium microbalum]|uniref:Zn(2)-C6 fungal-type domain-containing protein n=1 Tax=Synchytrium microbalum TaxID=1806994 RepID=A0A507C8P9_9FUNG|nr:uncharacterized protein SmJEL517_g01886 [Synchytrium microbalum]TPX35708.1 hypothetical protein SmJEL517_g01886 [Synchytrium microbalum]